MRQRRRGRWSRFSWPFGFTLVDLAVCTIIMLVLAAVLFPVFAKSREHWPHGSCMSNMKQLGLALIGYTQDYDGKFPSGSVAIRTKVILPSTSAGPSLPATHPGRSHGLGVGWAGGAEAYIKNPGIFKCPDDKRDKGLNAAGTTMLYPVSYAMNQWLASQSVLGLAEPSTTVLAFECSGSMVNVTSATEEGSGAFSPVGDGASDPKTGVPDFGDGFDTPTGVSNMVVNDYGAFARHDVGGAGGGGSMYLLADGHVKFLRFNQVSVGEAPVSQGKLGSGFAVSFNPVD